MVDVTNSSTHTSRFAGVLSTSQASFCVYLLEPRGGIRRRDKAAAGQLAAVQQQQHCWQLRWRRSVTMYKMDTEIQ